MAFPSERLQLTEKQKIMSDIKGKYLILYLGADWWGSDARALAATFRRSGHALIEMKYEDYFPSRWTSVPLRLLRRSIKRLCARNYNDMLREQIENKALDFIVVFKGVLLERRIIASAQRAGLKVYCFYPDVSYSEHGSNIWDCLAQYDAVFTTKSYHLESAKIIKQAKKLILTSHGYDPDVHRVLQLSSRVMEQYGCDVSFAGSWSSKKEGYLAALIAELPEKKIRIWGVGWTRASVRVRNRWMGREAFGDELALVYGASSINLGLLSESGQDTKCGDQTTTRTWQIPAAGGFLLHEDTEEVRQCFDPGKEIGLFRTKSDLVKAVSFYLEDEQRRHSIAAAGNRRCITSEYSYGRAADQICRYHAAYAATAI